MSELLPLDMQTEPSWFEGRLILRPKALTGKEGLPVSLSGDSLSLYLTLLSILSWSN